MGQLQYLETSHPCGSTLSSISFQQAIITVNLSTIIINLEERLKCLTQLLTRSMPD